MIVLNTRSFSDILQDVQEQQTEAAHANTYMAGWESTLDAAGFVQIMTQTHIYRAQSTYNRAKAYAPNPRTRNTAKLATEVTEVSSRPAHAFNTEQLEAFNFFKTISPKLANNFNKRQLKSAYRMAVLKTHPDTCGGFTATSESFQLVKKYYPILEAFVKNEA